MKKKLFIDFDGTLFDTRCFKKGIFDVFKSLDFTEDQVLLTYKKACEDYLYSPVEHLEGLQKIKKIDAKAVLSKVEELYEEVPSFLFEDSLGFLDGLNREKYEVILLTLGDEEFQKKKVGSSGVSEYFDKIYYCMDQKWIFLKSVVEIDEKFYIIDDRGDALFKILQDFTNSTPIEINRTAKPLDDMEKPSPYNGITVTNFEETMKYL
jgi:hypothetical protein